MGRIQEIDNEIYNLNEEKKRVEDELNFGTIEYVKSLEWLKDCNAHYSRVIVPYGGNSYVISLYGSCPRSASAVNIENGIYSYYPLSYETVFTVVAQQP